MRFIVHEQAYEIPIAAGQFRYERNGQLTGAIETWRLTQATEGYEVLRVDLDARQAVSEHSYLYHLVRQTNGRIERLTYRFWARDFNVKGNLLFSQTNITGTRTVNDTIYEEDLDVDGGYPFWFPSSIGLSLAVAASPLDDITAVTLNNNVHTKDALALQQVELSCSQWVHEQTELSIAGQMIHTTPWLLSWAGKQRVLFCDEKGWPVKMQRDDGLTAVEARYIWYT